MTQCRNRNRLLTGLAATAMALGTMWPGEVAAQELGEDPEVNSGRVSLDLGFDITNKYYFRGIIQEDRGVIVQPWAEVGFSLYENEEAAAFTSLDLSFGIWNSMHSKHTGAVSGPDLWYEADLYFGVSVGIIENLEGSIVYTAYTSPNGAFDTVEELALTLGYDDSGLWERMGVEDFGLSPYITLAVELDNTAFGPDEGVYLELGIEPSVEVVEDKLTLSFPVALGLSLDNYYEDILPSGRNRNRTFGFVQAGIVAGMPLNFIPAEYGAWDLSAGVHFLFLGSTLEDANHGDEFEVFGTIGISMSY